MLPPQANAELSVREMLRNMVVRKGKPGHPLVLEAEDFLDDGSPIHLKVTVDPQEVRLGVPVQSAAEGRRLAGPPGSELAVGQEGL